MHLAQTLLALCTAASAVLGAPTSSPSKLETRQTTFNGKSLSILPLGDSITYGVGSPSSNSYRATLLTSLTNAGAKVDYIGSVRSGTLPDKDNEGHPGWTIDQIAGAVANVGGTPSAVLLHAGTNDCNTYGWETAHERLGKLVDVVTAKWPRAAVLVAKIVPSTSANTQSNIAFFNSRVQGVVSQRANAGKKVAVVDMSTLNPATDLSDYLHPNDQGYSKMAGIWFNGLSAANGRGWL